MNVDASAEQIVDYRRCFDEIFVAGTPKLFNNEGAFLSFIIVLVGTDALAGLYEPSRTPGLRFKEFVARFYPANLAPMAERLWQLRNALVHSFNPGPFGLTHHNSRHHLTTVNGVTVLNAEDFYAALLHAAHGYFAALVVDPELVANFMKRTSEPGGGAPHTTLVDPAHG